MKRTISILLVLCMVLALVPVFGTQAKAASNLIINGVDIGYAAGQYFSTTGKKCACHGRGSCGKASDCTCKKVSGCCQCFGFALWCENKMYGCNDVAKSSKFENVGSVSAGKLTASKLKELISSAKIGAHIRTNKTSSNQAHSMILISKSSTGFTVAQANGSNNKEYSSWTPCRIGTATYTWSSYISSTYGPRGIDYIKQIKVDPTTKSLSNSSIVSELEQDSNGQIYYAGFARTSRLYDGNKQLTEGTDYTVSYQNNVNVGTMTATFTGKGSYSGTKTSSIRIIPFDISGSDAGSASWLTATLAYSSTEYDAAAKTPKVTLVYNAYNSGLKVMTLTEGTDYSVSYSNNVNVGTATVTVTGKGNFTGTKTLSFHIVENPNWRYLDLQGIFNGTEKNSIAEWGTADVYINDELVADDCTSFHRQFPSGTQYTIKDVRAKAGYNYAGDYRGYLSATIGSGADREICLRFTKETASVNVEDGTYLLVSALDNNKVIGVANNSTTSSANVELQTKRYAAGQYFMITKQGSYYRITSLNSGLDLDVQSSCREPRTNIKQFGYHDVDAQRWHFLDAGNGYVYVKSELGTMVTVSGGNTADGTNIMTYFNDETNSQRWKLVPIEELLRIIAKPKDCIGAVGSTAAFSVSANGDGLTYQWQFSDNGGRTWKNSSVKTAEYSTKLTSARDGRLVRCIVTDRYGNSLTSDAARMTIYKITITSQPKDYVGKVNSYATFSVAAQGDGLSYRWQISANGGKKWSNSSVKTAEYSSKLTSARDGRMLRCIITDAYGTKVTSDVVSMSIG